MRTSSIRLAFKKCKQENRPALLTYTVSGDPNKKKSFEILKAKPFAHGPDSKDAIAPWGVAVLGSCLGRSDTLLYNQIRSAIDYKNISCSSGLLSAIHFGTVANFTPA